MNACPNPTVVHVTWQRFGDMVERLTHQIGHDTPQTLVAVLRGGAIPAVMLAHRLGLRDVRAVEVTHTADDGHHAPKTPAPVAVNPSSLGELTGRDVLIVDDVAGTGHTLAAAAYFAAQAGAARVRTAVCVLNADNWTFLVPEEEAATHVVEVTRGWVVFPWERSDAP